MGYDGYMIRQIRGHVLAIEPLGAVLDVAGFGLFVYMTAPNEVSVGTEQVLHTHLAVRQDGADLYGFPSPTERAFFELILTVPNVGPKTALSILRRSSADALLGAIAKRDVEYLTRIVGLGKKTAEKMIVELFEKAGKGDTHNSVDTEVFDTLVALGYTEREARRALTDVPESITGKEARLKAALAGKRTS